MKLRVSVTLNINKKYTCHSFYLSPSPCLFFKYTSVKMKKRLTYVKPAVSDNKILIVATHRCVVNL